MTAPFKNTLIRCLCLAMCCMALLALPATGLAQDEEAADTVMVDNNYLPDSVAASVTGEAGDSDQEKLPPVAPELRQVPDSVVGKLKADKDFAYANDPAYWKKEPAEVEARTRQGEGGSRPSRSLSEGFDDFFSGRPVRIFFYCLIGALLLLLLYRIVMVNNLFMTRSSKRRPADDELQEELLDNSSLDTRIRNAIAEKNYRAAVRYMYLKTLKGLQEKGWIRYHAQGTNHEYIAQVGPYGVGREFRFLTHVYEYVWYGEFTLSQAQFDQVHQHFQQFYNSAKL